MIRRLLPCLVLFASCKVFQDTEPPAAKGQSISLAQASYGPNARPPAKECEFESELTEAIAKSVPGAKVESSADQQMSVTITRVQGADPSWQGEISVIVEGELAGTETRRFRFKRGAPGGVTGGMRGVCKGLENVAKLLADDIAEWVAAPQDDDEPTSSAPAEHHEESSVRAEETPETSEARNVAMDEILE